MKPIQIARICRLYQKLKQGDKNAKNALEKIGLHGNKVMVMRAIESLVKSNFQKGFA
jgi:hypothetical protein